MKFKKVSLFIVDSDVMGVTPKELLPLLGQPFRLLTLSTILLLFFNFRKEIKD
jgi:hypothetical protein